MRKRIFRDVVCVSLALVAVMSALMLGGLYLLYTNQTKQTLRQETQALSALIEAGGDPIATVSRSAIASRITLISKDGTVIYDSSAPSGSMENHLARAEIAAAIEKGEGESKRESATLGEELIYYASRLRSGDVIRLAAAQKSVMGLLGQTAGCVIAGAVIAILLAAVIARYQTKRLVAPINGLNLDEPMQNDVYEELSPVLRRLNHQKEEIESRMTALQEKRGELDAIISGMREGLILLDDKKRVLSVNRSALALLGGKGGETLNRLYRGERLIKLVDEAYEKGSAAGDMALNGRDCRVSASLANTGGMVVLFQDITQQRRAEEARREFTANVSHELRTPLTSIRGYAELLRSGMVNSEDIAGFGGRIYDESQRLLTLIEDILRLSRLDEGVIGDVSRVGLLEIAKGVTERLKEQAGAAGVTLEALGEEAYVTGERTLIYELVYNLADNAIKYNKNGGSAIIEVTRDGERARLTVTDTGVGIPKESRPRVFERFYRVDKSRSKATGGTGLGLSIVKHAAELSGATVSLESETDKGTRITVEFPKSEQ